MGRSGLIGAVLTVDAQICVEDQQILNDSLCLRIEFDTVNYAMRVYGSFVVEYKKVTSLGTILT